MEPETQNNEAPLGEAVGLSAPTTPQTLSVVSTTGSDIQRPAPLRVPAVPTPPPVIQKSVGVDIEKILLPTKEIYTSASAQRVNAGVLFEQEKTATLAPSAPTSLPPMVGVEPVIPNTFAVQPLETFQGDVAKVIQEKNTTLVSAVAAESDQRHSGINIEDVDSTKTLVQQWITRTGLVVGGTLLVVATGLVVYVYVLRPTSVAVQNIPPAPFILVDDSVRVPLLSERQNRATTMGALNDAKNKVALSLGLVARIEPVTMQSAVDPAPTTMYSHDFLQILSPSIPPALLRSIQPTFLLGVHSATNNQPFLILKVDSYEQSFSGMLAWEDTLRGDLAPLFTYTPRERIPEEHMEVSTTSAQKFLTSEFVDKIIENHDARVAQNAVGDVFFLWTFLDHNTIVVTTNSYTLREIISRLKDAPVI